MHIFIPAKSIAATAILSTVVSVSVGPPRPLASYNLPVRPEATFGACSVGADSSYAVVGMAWGGRSPITGGYDHFCRAFTLISLRTGTRRTIARLPTSQQRGLWTVDQPVFLGDWLAYDRYVGVAGGNWEIDLVNVRSGATRRLDRWHGPGTMAVGPTLIGSGRILVWESGVRDRQGRVVDQIHTYDTSSGAGRIVATSQAGTQFVHAAISGPIICFMEQSIRGSDIWVEDLRTGHVRQLTHSGRATESVITGPWVAWGIIGPDDLGPVVVEDLRTGRRQTVTTIPSYILTAGNGLLAWYGSRTDRWTVLDLVTGRQWETTHIAGQQEHATMARVQGDVIAENALSPAGLAGRVVVYRHRALPVAPLF